MDKPVVLKEAGLGIVWAEVIVLAADDDTSLSGGTMTLVLWARRSCEKACAGSLFTMHKMVFTILLSEKPAALPTGDRYPNSRIQLSLEKVAGARFELTTSRL